MANQSRLRHLPLAVIPLMILLTGCGRKPPPPAERFFDYGVGKVNLERVTYITPRIKIGIDEFPLNAAGIQTVSGHLREGRWSYFDVQALIFFDEFAWRVYRSKTFDKTDNPLTPDHIAAIERELNAALQRYQAIR